ncbi:hypothetical protein [Polyangium mundeleinium]|uniref:Uncharacterized protein n=1 Tax=Polyangium mundeleinium TaxID=2995306 RepID=A0ABT5EY75_9BACT|nr:hypothetical protein [Polyangium mundeleinium]MDC0745765.1 hypothetical protein [Polyangium mundeleinium]
MALQLLIAGRRPFPPGEDPWSISLSYDGNNNIDEGSLDAWNDDDPELMHYASTIVGYQPASLVAVRPAGWSLSEVVAQAIAEALDGVVFFTGFDGRTHLEPDARGETPEIATRKELTRHVRRAFKSHKPYLARIKQAIRKRSPPPRDNDGSDE